jgi:predicted Zn-dependent protease
MRALCLLALSFHAVAAQDPLAQADRFIAAGQFRQALAALAQNPPRNARFHLLASKAYDGLNDPARAVSEAEAALALEPRNEAAHLQLGQIFLSRNTPAAAYDIFTEAQQLFPQSFLIRLGRGLALKELRRYEEAAAELSACLARNPASGIVFDALATVYLHASRFDDLQQLAAEYTARNGADYRGYYYLAAAREGLGQAEDATLGLLQKSLARKSDFAASLSLKGKLLLRQNAPAEAASVLERAIALRPDHVPSHMALAAAYRKLDRREDAARQFQLVRELLDKQQNQPPPTLRYRRGPASPNASLPRAP